MKTLNILFEIVSFAAVCIITGAICLFALYCGAIVATYVGDYLDICGTWKALFLTPILFVVASTVALFFSTGLRKFNQR